MKKAIGLFVIIIMVILTLPTNSFAEVLTEQKLEQKLIDKFNDMYADMSDGFSCEKNIDGNVMRFTRGPFADGLPDKDGTYELDLDNNKIIQNDDPMSRIYEYTYKFENNKLIISCDSNIKTNTVSYPKTAYIIERITWIYDYICELYNVDLNVDGKNNYISYIIDEDIVYKSPECMVKSKEYTLISDKKYADTVLLTSTRRSDTLKLSLIINLDESAYSNIKNYKSEVKSDYRKKKNLDDNIISTNSNPNKQTVTIEKILEGFERFKELDVQKQKYNLKAEGNTLFFDFGAGFEYGRQVEVEISEDFVNMYFKALINQGKGNGNLAYESEKDLEMLEIIYCIIADIQGVNMDNAKKYFSSIIDKYSTNPINYIDSNSMYYGKFRIFNSDISIVNENYEFKSEDEIYSKIKTCDVENYMKNSIQYQNKKNITHDYNEYSTFSIDLSIDCNRNEYGYKADFNNKINLNGNFQKLEDEKDIKNNNGNATGNNYSNNNNGDANTSSNGNSNKETQKENQVTKLPYSGLPYYKSIFILKIITMVLISCLIIIIILKKKTNIK